MKKLVLLLLFLCSISSFSQEEIKIDEVLTNIEMLIENNQKKEAKKLIKALPKGSFTDGQNYRYQQILKRVHTSQVGLSYDLISFSEEYTSQNTWSNISVDYQHLIGATTLIGRITHSNRTQLNGTLYELESYPVFSKKSEIILSFGKPMDVLGNFVDENGDMFENRKMISKDNISHDRMISSIDNISQKII